MSILEKVLKEFEKLSAIPRPSKNEYKVAGYLSERLKTLGAAVNIDSIGNVIGEVPATEGLENMPLVVLQAHMDMVCVSDGSVKYSPLNDGIKLKREGKYLKAEGTSLGADDGIGIAIILYLLSTMKEHGRWRIIFTVDEESGMSGAKSLEPKYLTDAKFLINVDSENVKEIVTGSAGSAKIEFVRKIEWTAPEPEEEGYMVRISGLKGGHSGEVIHRKRLNAIKVLAHVLECLNSRVIYIHGGSAANVIAPEARASILLPKSFELNGNNLKKVCEGIALEYIRKYNEPNMEIKVRKVKPAGRVMQKEDSKAVVTLLNKLTSGVFSGRESRDGSKSDRVSANIGTIKSTSSAVYVEYMPRFHSLKGFEKIHLHTTRAFIESGCDEFNIKALSREWQSESNDLAMCMMKVAEEQGYPRKLRVIHGGLECSHFIEKAPQLQIVSVGTTNLDIHSPKEKLELSSVEPTVALILGTLEHLAKNKPEV